MTDLKHPLQGHQKALSIFFSIDDFWTNIGKNLLRRNTVKPWNGLLVTLWDNLTGSSKMYTVSAQNTPWVKGMVCKFIIKPFWCF